MKKLSTIFATVLLAACASPEPPPPPIRPAVVMTIRTADAGSLAAYAGEVRARHEVDLSFRIGGKIVDRRVGLGDTVRKGDVLARIDAGDATLSAAAGKAQLAAAEADLALARAEHDRAGSLAEKKFISATAVDTRRAQWQAAAARVEQARAQSGVAGNQLGYTTLVADRPGVITAAPGETGQVVAAGQAVFRLADPAEREVLIHVPETRASLFRPGQAALVRPWNSQEMTLRGSVREVAASADSATRTFAVRVSVPNPAKAADGADPLPLGTSAAVGFPQMARDAVVVPRAAVVQRDGRSQVWIVGGDGKVAARPVETDSFRDNGILVRAGLNAGERVVIAGASTLVAGMQVKPIEERAAPALDAGRRP